MNHNYSFYVLDLDIYFKNSVDKTIYFDERTYAFLTQVDSIPENMSRRIIILNNVEVTVPISSLMSDLVYLQVSSKCKSAILK